MYVVTDRGASVSAFGEQRVRRDTGKEIAAEELRILIDLYEKRKVHVELERSLDLANLDDLQVARALFAAPAVRVACDAQGVTQIDRDVLTGRELDMI